MATELLVSAENWNAIRFGAGRGCFGNRPRLLDWDVEEREARVQLSAANDPFALRDGNAHVVGRVAKEVDPFFFSRCYWRPRDDSNVRPTV